MSGRDQQYLDSRIFGSKNESNLSKDNQARNLVAHRTEDETFAKAVNIQKEKPSGSIYDTTKTFSASKHIKAKDIGTWVTVIGVNPGRIDEVVRFFSKFGPILRVNDTSGNWIYLEYQSVEIAKKVVESCSGSPQLITNKMAVSCVLGRVRSEYIAESPKPPDSVDFIPKSESIVIPEEKKGIIGSIFDSIFG